MLKGLLKSCLKFLLPMALVRRIPENIKWFCWWLFRTKYLVGVFVVAIKGNTFLAIRKVYGVSEGWQIPGGGKDRPSEKADLNYLSTHFISNLAKTELHEEAGLSTDLLLNTPFYLAGVSTVEGHRDLQVIYVCEIGNHIEEVPKPIDTLEIGEARFLPLRDADQYLNYDHLRILEMGYRRLMEIYDLHANAFRPDKVVVPFIHK